ncbi:short-chain dehydrogenase reductase SDR [Companilactobacillus mindensis DSM 14500]|uniref:Short-chain dehydrogenase reductase SDR n=1 Tax=Companilactobacillus mindensis DSM 14500 TaxID=1423770 RepID=A0A0R1QQ08_9LACO|nr:SDR family oxidoreductase [Companilactobacillus mindensis]KRL44772.1 short-chain dehydrogenase reductase SDR [Companilactobacillus mindensis DSM 14500]GEO78050.1 putative oxidoreductase YoxD [Companilactobacillus mindensis]
MENLEGKTAIITGASSGFGKGTALAFAKAGCDLVLTGFNSDKLQAAATECKEFGVKVVYFAGDIQDEQTAIKTVNLAMENFGQIDILVNNAGIGRTLSIEETSMSDFDLVMNTNVRGAFAFTKYVVPEMKRRHDGQIIMVSSVTGIKGHADESAYTCSKFALRGLAQSLDKELLADGIKTCVICPHAGATNFEVGYGRTKKGVAQSGFLTPEDVGQAMVSICFQPKNSRIVELRLASNNVKY